jgi:hypothetical protein
MVMRRKSPDLEIEYSVISPGSSLCYKHRKFSHYLNSLHGHYSYLQLSHMFRTLVSFLIVPFFADTSPLLISRLALH